ncbi:MAG: transporter substrate-binding domain-containing protein [Cyanobacteria bacterium CRU_2_1]|nr:transporter substrate-binding domain-containing protein [Cyanobacteria bacterium RU_5_0]NJR62314.1 transporter substrate-binding domain-containing protein [Cyanobacteria bacterium CRU_2_1]
MFYERLGQLSLAGLSFVFWGSLGAIGLPSHAAELSEIQQRGYLTVGVKDNLRPLGFRDAEGNLEGLEIDLAHWLAEHLLGDAEAIVLQPLSNQERLSALLDDEVDLVIARLSATVSRARLVDFSTPYYLDGTAFVTRNGAIQQLTDLQQQTISVLDDSDTIAIVRSALPNAQLVGVSSYAQAKDFLETGQASAFAADVSVLIGWIQEYPEYHVLPTLLSADALVVAMPRGLQYDDLRQQVNQAIAQWQTEGVMRQQVLHWGLPEAGIPEMRTELGAE